MAETAFSMGSTVTCDDGPCGEIRRVVVGPVAWRLTHLVVEPTHRNGLGRLVPLDLVRADSSGAHLLGGLAVFEGLPLAEETDFLPGGSGYESYEAHEAYFWPYFGLEGAGATAPSLANASGLVTRDRVPMGEVEVRRGERLHAMDGEMGKVEGLVVDAADGHVTHVLLREGHLWGRKQVAIPIGVVTRIDDGISVALSKNDIGRLPPVGLTGEPG